jgi:hypothetical protein
VLLPVEGVFAAGGELHSPREVTELSGLDLDYLIRLQQALGFPQPDPDEKVLTDTEVEGAKRRGLVRAPGQPRRPDHRLRPPRQRRRRRSAEGGAGR